ncbi:MAG: tRNA (adenine(22)-N(1))-methyltransferase TrmK [Bdellovibrionota bacterium]
MSTRIDKIVSLIRPGHTVFDMCCDHGLIGFGALSKVKEVVFVDQSAKALAPLNEHLKSLDRADLERIKVFVSAGELVSIAGYESSDFVIAGVGVTTVASIIASLFPEGLSHHRLILSPQQDSQPLRWYLNDRGFGLVDEYVVKERGRFREILVVEAQGSRIADTFMSERDELCREFKAWLLECRTFIAQKKLEKT